MLSKNPFIFKYNPEYIKDNQNQFIEGNYIKMTIRISLYSHIGECSDSDNEESEKQYIEEVYFNIPDYFTNEHGELLQKYYDKNNIIIECEDTKEWFQPWSYEECCSKSGCCNYVNTYFPIKYEYVKV